MARAQAAFYVDQYNRDAEFYNEALSLMQEAEILSKSADHNDLVDACSALEKAGDIARGIQTIDTARITHAIAKIETRIRLI